MPDRFKGPRLAESFGGLVLLILYIPAAVFWLGFVISSLWLWFVVPLGVPSIGIWHAAALSFLAHVALPNNYKKEASVDWLSWREWIAKLATRPAAALLGLGIGYAIHIWAM